MIRQLHINNYKSLFDLTLEVGRFNVLIGENRHSLTDRQANLTYWVRREVKALGKD
ncbi:hypothetical protein [Methylovulum psychrotolerans]|uniref:Chromosome segregation protein SMC n=1 Tax=Methylovulum psychrotolerans TaxID=1704499 RepID=A0A2S5CS75_9GAMM|nr:hypothetical protein [Methylovulum psychrotolerans]MBT9097956.1 hypothetical protein [Methylovulum psychrotolerans]POZ53655.1 chromosome segregation protein SMC [Methylovulum psychrotolerans]